MDAQAKTKINAPAILSKHMLEIILILLFIIMAITSDAFIKPGNLLNILRNVSMTGIIAFGMTFVIIAGEIDLSVGSTVALSGVITALTAGKLSEAGIMPMESAVVLGMILAVIVSIGIGLFNGFLLTKFKMPSFIITLGMLNLLYGVAAVISSGFPVTTLPSWYSVFGAGSIGGILPVPAVFLVAVFIIVLIILKYSRFGRAVYAVGGNPESARLSGINVNKVKTSVMMIVQACCAISGILLSSQVMSGTFSFGRGWEMTAISAVIIGGASLAGGRGTASGTFLGLLFLGIINNAMTLNGVDEYVQYIVQGALIIGAVLINSFQNKKKD
ncbi:ABC transporter permease [Christensenella intestinihominis]|uniref:ABC transporter permease n=1 Tax=Christensenella intestinihominis TaxID=1851429 RepID=UPI00082D348D|nr:ABC transporter permease [Christensenella intestinihominis]